MKKLRIIICTPDMNRPVARKCIDQIKATDLSDAELVIVDNAYDRNFSHPAVMNRFLNQGDDLPVIFVDDDVVIDDKDWLSALLKTSEACAASIVGCVHTFGSGEVNHTGILAYKDATSELMREPLSSEKFVYVPGVSSAVVLIRDPRELSFDTMFKKYQHDIDICMQAWAQDKKVVCCTELKVVHIQAEYMSSQPGFRDILDQDSRYFQTKWGEYARQALYNIPELRDFAEMACQRNWERYYNQATRVSSEDPEKAAEMLREIIRECPYQWRAGSAYYHLYRIEKNRSHLKNCVRLHPYHMKARSLLRDA